MHRRRILIFSLTYDPRHYGGAEVAVQAITDRLSPEKYEFELLCLRFDSTLPPTERCGNVLVHRIGPVRLSPSPKDLKSWPLHYAKHVFQLHAALGAHLLHNKSPYDAVWANMAQSAGIPASIFKLVHPRVPYILTLQEGSPPAYIERLMVPVWPLFRRAFTTPNIIHAISTHLAAWAKYRGAKCPIVVVPNGVDIEKFAVASSDTRHDDQLAVLRARGGIVLITTSRLVPKNAVDIVIRALPLLPSHINFVIYGEGPEEAALRSLCHSLNVESRVHFNGMLDHDRLPMALHAADIFIRPSRSEGLGISFIEAMAAGLPVIATQEGGIADFLMDSVKNPDRPTTGWAVERDSPQDVADAVLTILARPDRTRVVVSAARAMVATQYDWDRIAQRFEKNILDVVLSPHAMAPMAIC